MGKSKNSRVAQFYLSTSYSNMSPLCQHLEQHPKCHQCSPEDNWLGCSRTNPEATKTQACHELKVLEHQGAGRERSFCSMTDMFKLDWNFLQAKCLLEKKVLWWNETKLSDNFMSLWTAYNVNYISGQHHCWNLCCGGTICAVVANALLWSPPKS